MATPVNKRKKPEENSPSKKSNKKAKETLEKCVTCNKDAKLDAVECQWCRKWEHRVCAGISQNEYNMLSKSCKKIMFFCTLCFSKVSFALRVESEASTKSQELEIFNTRLEAVEEKLTKALEGFKVYMDTQHKANPKEIFEQDPDDSYAHLATSIVAEQKEKEKRQLNLILHNFKESLEEEPSNRKKDDVNGARSLFSEYIGVEATVTNAIRIGKKGVKPRLLKVSVSNLEDKISILRGKMKLRNEGNPDYIKSVFITADYTPLEQKKNKILREKLNDMNKDGNNYIIKNGRIVLRRS